MYNKFIRQNKENLETSITSYNKGTSLVSIIAYDHIGEKDYFQTLEEKVNEHDIVLYEPFNKNKANQKQAELFELTSQGFAIDYTKLPKNWINAENSAKTKIKDFFYIGLTILSAIPFIPFFLYLRKNLKNGEKEELIKITIKMFESSPYKQLNSLVGKALEFRRRSAIKNFERINKHNDSIAFLYGAGHASYFEKYLLDKGYTEMKKEWLTAIKIN